MTDADGRARRVEYVADEAGFRAKVQTNEVGTKQANSADVEVLASPPTEGQLVYQAQPQQVQRAQVQTVAVQQQPQLARFGQQQTVFGYQQQQPAGYRQTNYLYQPGTAGYRNGAYGYGNGAYGNGAYGYGAYGSQLNGAYAYPSSAGYSTYGTTTNGLGYATYPAGYARSGSYGYGSYQPGSYGYTSTTGAPVGMNYNYHTPASYYSAVGGQQQGYSTLGGARYTTTSAQVQPARSAGTASGSSNYIVLKSKRDASDKKSE